VILEAGVGGADGGHDSGRAAPQDDYIRFDGVLLVVFDLIGPLKGGFSVFYQVLIHLYLK
jgi:hypothetical protein